jgi:hypothetical protein
VLVCLGFTGAGIAWADDAHDQEHWADSPYAPHVTKGPVVKLGTVVGFISGERVDVTAIGLAVAGGHRFGRLTLESEYQYLRFQERGPSSRWLGDGHRVGVIGRFDLIRIGSRYVGGNSLLSIYVEGGAAVAWNLWSKPDYRDPQRVVPGDSKRVEGQAGFGIEIDHRLQEPIGFPKRIGWFLGWRLAFAPHEVGPASVCRGASCRLAPMMPMERYTDRSMLFQSSLAVTW